MPTVEHTTPASVDPADFVTALHEEGQLPQNAGGDPSVPDSAFPQHHVYQQPATA
jgi:serine/threonine protein kinase HipA of HipAB toxin-antitoxin module